jgi:DNA-binding XRE family transcriptional regulator
MTPAQCRAARALLDWTQNDLARSAEVGSVTLRQFERGQPFPAEPFCQPYGESLRNVRFIAANKGGGPGARPREDTP